jgi:hypothetical protein
MLKIKSIGYAEKVKICYEIDGDKYTVESKELPSAQFKSAFFDLKHIAAKVAGIVQAPTRLDITYLVGDEAQVKEISLIVEQAFQPPFSGEMVTRLPGIMAGELKESDLEIVTACILNAGEYLKGNRAQMQLIFE